MPDELARACEQFEAVMLKQMLTEAGVGRGIGLGRDDASSDGDRDDSQYGGGADIMQSMFADVIAQAVAGADRAGLARALATSLRRLAP